MMYEEETMGDILLRNTYEDFVETYYRFHDDNVRKLDQYKNDPLMKRAHIQRYPYLKGKKLSYSLIHTLFTYPEFERFNTEVFRKYVFAHLTKKIRGIFKHGQCAKTQISCIKIANDIHKNVLSIAITKNTLLANRQWTTRFIRHLRKAGITTDLRKEILVISSTVNDLGGNATHCKNKAEAWDAICKNGNQFKVIFVCANSVRIADVCKLLNDYTLPIFNGACRKDIVIQYDEAHNLKTGVPQCREMIENMLLYDFVKEFIPITASYNPVPDPSNPIWLKPYIDQNKLNYVNDDLANSRMKSDDEGYSSISDAWSIDFDDYYQPSTYDNTISQDLFDKHYPNKDYERMGFVNACPIGFCGDEELALNSGKQVLDNQLTLDLSNDHDADNSDANDVETVFKSDVGNISVMLTPCRTVITEMLMIYASERPYNPVSIGLFRSKINYRYRRLETGEMMVGEIAYEAREFNEILNGWLDNFDLKSRCVIIMGNYLSIGESNTFVHSDYGYLRSAILLPGCNLSAEQNYQFLLRCCFLIGGFPGLTKPNVQKFIIGPNDAINDAINYEELNDRIVQELIDNPNDSDFVFDYDENADGTLTATNTAHTPTARHSVPVQFKIEDEESDHIKELRRIMRIDHRTPEDKTDFMTHLLLAIEEQSIEVNDKNAPRIRLADYQYTLTEFRCYKEGFNADNYRFYGYYEKWYTSTSYNNGELQVGQCSICSCLKRHKGTTRHGEHINNPNTFYMTFMY
jgi:hypothetical protein